jgi:hypothetical protein
MQWNRNRIKCGRPVVKQTFVEGQQKGGGVPMWVYAAPQEVEKNSDHSPVFQPYGLLACLLTFTG